MTPIEFVLWLNGASEMVGEGVPSPEQWATIREGLSKTIGPIIAKKLLDTSENLYDNEERARRDAERETELHKLRMDNYKRQMGLVAKNQMAGKAYKTMGGLSSNFTTAADDTVIYPPEVIMQAPSQNTGLLSRLLAKKKF